MEQLLIEDGIDPIEYLANANPKRYLIRLRVGDIRVIDNSLKIAPDSSGDNDKYHGSIWGIKSKHRKKLRKISTWLRAPDDVDIESHI